MTFPACFSERENDPERLTCICICVFVSEGFTLPYNVKVKLQYKQQTGAGSREDREGVEPGGQMQVDKCSPGGWPRANKNRAPVPSYGAMKRAAGFCTNCVSIGGGSLILLPQGETNHYSCHSRLAVEATVRHSKLGQGISLSSRVEPISFICHALFYSFVFGQERFCHLPRLLGPPSPSSLSVRLLSILASLGGCAERERSWTAGSRVYPKREKKNKRSDRTMRMWEWIYSLLLGQSSNSEDRGWQLSLLLSLVFSPAAAAQLPLYWGHGGIRRVKEACGWRTAFEQQRTHTLIPHSTVTASPWVRLSLMTDFIMYSAGIICLFFSSGGVAERHREKRWMMLSFRCWNNVWLFFTFFNSTCPFPPQNDSILFSNTEGILLAIWVSFLLFLFHSLKIAHIYSIKTIKNEDRVRCS